MEILVYKEASILKAFQELSITVKYILSQEDLMENIIGASILFLPVEAGNLSLVDKVQAVNPKINVILIADDAQASYDAFKKHVSGYMIRPFTKEDVMDELKNIRYGEYSLLSVQCFGQFELIMNGVSLPFPRKKAKELFALLVDRRGGTVLVDEICEVLFKEVNDKKRRYIYVLKFELIKVLKEFDLDKIICNRNNGFALDTRGLDCDYFKFFDGQKELFRGEYMSQYDWAKKTLEELQEKA